MADVEGDFTLTMAELRAVARFVAESADEVLDVFERATPGDDRPREAIAAARAFVDGAPRSRRQRVAALDAHRAAAEASTELARLAARCAGDAAAAAYLHPIARASQVGHILRAAATVARLAELGVDVEPEAAARSLERSRLRATPVLVDVLRRYPRPSPRSGGSRVAILMGELDAVLRADAVLRRAELRAMSSADRELVTISDGLVGGPRIGRVMNPSRPPDLPRSPRPALPAATPRPPEPMRATTPTTSTGGLPRGA